MLVDEALAVEEEVEPSEVAIHHRRLHEHRFHAKLGEREASFEDGRLGALDVDIQQINPLHVERPQDLTDHQAIHHRVTRTIAAAVRAIIIDRLKTGAAAHFALNVESSLCCDCCPVRTPVSAYIRASC